jgi:predicted lysophospholipase L1 biosynthesis ABC-type transport system permease subunit
MKCLTQANNFFLFFNKKALAEAPKVYINIFTSYHKANNIDPDNC